MTEINDNDISNTKIKVHHEKKLGSIKMNRPVSNNIQYISEDNKHFENYIPKELNCNLKQIVKKGLSLPAKNKSHILYNKIEESTFINEYLNKYLCLDLIAKFNDHVKFGLVYAISYFETMMTNEENNMTPERMSNLMEKLKALKIQKEEENKI